MGHGRGDKLLGSFNKKAEDFISNDALSEELFLKMRNLFMNKILTFLKIKYYSVSLVTLMKTSRKV